MLVFLWRHDVLSSLVTYAGVLRHTRVYTVLLQFYYEHSHINCTHKRQTDSLCSPAVKSTSTKKPVLLIIQLRNADLNQKQQSHNENRTILVHVDARPELQQCHDIRTITTENIIFRGLLNVVCVLQRTSAVRSRERCLRGSENVVYVVQGTLFAWFRERSLRGSRNVFFLRGNSILSQWINKCTEYTFMYGPMSKKVQSSEAQFTFRLLFTSPSNDPRN